MRSVGKIIGELNPQLWREAKSRLTTRNLNIATITSFLAQFLFFVYYCNKLDYIFIDLDAPFREFDFDAHLELFALLSIIITLVLLVGGTYLLVKDLGKEQRHGTLNFIRQTPQSPSTIFLGKLLGVPILLYLAVGLAIPLHFRLGINVQIPLSQIFFFYGLLIATCGFFFSLALLFSLVSSSLFGLEAWLASGVVLVWLCFATDPTTHFLWGWLGAFSPLFLLPMWLKSLYFADFPFSGSEFLELGWLLFFLINYFFLTRWIFQAFKRRYQHPNIPIITKKQSYLFSAFFTIIIWGLGSQKYSDVTVYEIIFQHSIEVYFGHLFLLLGLTVMISPNRETLLGWKKSRKLKSFPRRRSLLKDLLIGEESPAIVAVGVNLAIAVIPWLLFSIITILSPLLFAKSGDWLTYLKSLPINGFYLLALVIFNYSWIGIWVTVL
ncbi:MAG: hypothetical protein SAK42_20060, partial [Oscillatoria sp. PMC 1076.18]|nr:hypothetical protein [Oscillatoria sp. PMC 1076.18]